MAGYGNRMILGFPACHAALAVLLCLPLAGASAVGVTAPAPAAAPLAAKLGFTVEPLDTLIAQHMGVPETTQGLVVTSLAFKGPTAAAGIKIGDIIQAIDGKSLAGPKGAKVLADHRGPAQLTVLRAGVTSVVTIG